MADLRAAGVRMAPPADLAGALVVFCNPLLDMTAAVEPDLLARYGLRPDDAIIAGPEHGGLFADLLAGYPVAYSAGGAGQNTARAAQFLLPPGSTVYIGCIGTDANGRILEQAAAADGLRVEYMRDAAGTQTGTCACLITGRSRSLVARLGAASNYHRSHLLLAAMQSHLAAARLTYITGFFLTVSPETILHVAELAHAGGKLFAMNLSAPFLSRLFREQLLQTLPYVDYLFGNEAEALAFAEANALHTTDIPEIAHRLADWPRHAGSRARTVVITQGPHPTIVCTGGQTAHSVHPTPFIPAAEIVDTNGAGDAFVGGFLSRLLQQRPLDDCIATGHWLAGFIIRQAGVVFPKDQRANGWATQD